MKRELDSEKEGRVVKRVFAAQCDGIKDTMSSMVKLATGTGEFPDVGQPTGKCQLWWCPPRESLLHRDARRRLLTSASTWTSTTACTPEGADIDAIVKEGEDPSVEEGHDVVRATARSYVKLPAGKYPAMRSGTTALLNSSWNDIDFNDCVHVLLSEGAGTYAIAKEKSSHFREEGHDVERNIYGAERRGQGHDVSYDEARDEFDEPDIGQPVGEGWLHGEVNSYPRRVEQKAPCSVPWRCTLKCAGM